MAKPEAVKPLTISNTKKEMLDAYAQLQDRLKQKAEAEMKPEVKVEEKKTREAVETADALSTEGISKEIGRLRADIGAMLMQVSDKVETETSKYVQVKRALEAKEQELREIFEIEKSATTLMTLLEVQRQKREQFEREYVRLYTETQDETSPASEPAKVTLTKVEVVPPAPVPPAPLPASPTPPAPVSPPSHLGLILAAGALVLIVAAGLLYKTLAGKTR